MQNYRRVKRNTFKWLRVIYILWTVLLSGLTVWYLKERNPKTLICLGVSTVIVIVYFLIIYPKFKERKKYVKNIQEYIIVNELYDEKQVRGKIIDAFPEVYLRIDREHNLLCIKFRLPGNAVNFRGLEGDLQDRLKTICLNVFEERGYVIYVFQLNKEERLVIDSKEEIEVQNNDYKIRLSPSIIWDYKQYPHFLVTGTSGVGKSTFICYLIESLTRKNVRVIYIDKKRDVEMERFCCNNSMIKYVSDAEDIVKELAEIVEELEIRGKDIENIGIGEEFNYSFNEIFVIVDEIILLKLSMPDKLYKEAIAYINSIISSGRSKNIFCGLASQSGLAEYMGNSGIRGNLALKIVLGQARSSEIGMVFGEEFSNIKNLRISEKGSGHMMIVGQDTRPKEYVTPWIKNGIL